MTSPLEPEICPVDLKARSRAICVQKQERFLSELRASGDLKTALMLARTRKRAYTEWLNTDADFEKQVKELLYVKPVISDRTEPIIAAICNVYGVERKYIHYSHHGAYSLARHACCYFIRKKVIIDDKPITYARIARLVGKYNHYAVIGSELTYRDLLPSNKLVKENHKKITDILNGA